MSNNYGKYNKFVEVQKPLGLSQHRLGKKVGISRTSINKIETGKTIPSLKTANDIANALDVCIYQIFDLDGRGHYKCLGSNCSNN
ncbi:helix-turn-helix domain-containing protein [Finegoldia sp. BIOML-A2]|uniref:helix-turn-helix domain-containing protein n=1 Tax=unclassified Finegoldia TaxID=2619637 RepID=UPI001324E79D|nr:helix-turn-helix domain-containing protein [Finegoldia sp. BIOML-A5]MSB00908.1 helix-turn-helix domain-containing protein [Finegoldia sp. BIOML-A2]